MRAIALPSRRPRRGDQPASRREDEDVVGVECGLERVAGRKFVHAGQQRPPSSCRRASTWTKLSEPVISVSATVAGKTWWPRRPVGEDELVGAEADMCTARRPAPA